MAVEIYADSLKLLQASSPEGIALTMHSVTAGLRSGHWLSGSHRYRDRGNRRGNNRLREDLSQGTIHNEELSQYIGISAPVHSMDGWGLLGRSMHCLLRGDSYTAVHLAYYAELRAALAILASQGIGIFNDSHCVVDSTGKCKIVTPVDEGGKRIGNHMWTWLVFQWWSREPRAVDLLREVIKPNVDSLGTWIEGMTKARFSLAEVGAKWLELWGIDIRRYFADRDARNAASYWPNTINSWQSRIAAEDYEAVYNIWSPLEPTQETRFSELDKHLLRIVLFDGYFGATGQRATSDTGREGFADEVNSLLHNMGMNEVAKAIWQEFLTNDRSELPIIEMASGKAKVGGTTHVVEVMCRATMLLRLAVGASAGLLSDAGIERGHLEFWIESIGIGRGIWKPNESPDALVDLWTEIGHEVDELRGWEGQTAASAREAWSSQTQKLAVLEECERVALWGLGL